MNFALRGMEYGRQVKSFKFHSYLGANSCFLLIVNKLRFVCKVEGRERIEAAC